MRRPLEKLLPLRTLRLGLQLGVLSGAAWALCLEPWSSFASEPPFIAGEQSTRKNPLRGPVDSGVDVPVNELRGSARSASAWRNELFAVEGQHDHLVTTLNLLGALSCDPASALGGSIRSVTCSLIVECAERSLESSSSLEIANAVSNEPAKFTQGEGFLASESSLEISEAGPEVTRAPKKRELKTSDEDMKDYLAQEFEPTQMPQTDRSLQGIDAEKAKKPELYGESRYGESQSEESISDSSVDRQSTRSSSAPDQAESFYGTAAQRARLDQVQLALDYYLENPETTAARSPWAVMHALLAFGSDYEMIGPSNQRVNAIGWMCHNGLCRTQRIFTPRGNSFVPNVGGGVQGHQGQFLAILAQCQVPPDYPIQIGNQKFTVEDLVLYEMATCREKSELTFKLIGLSYYLDSDKQWRANDGRVWSIQRLIQEELAQPVVGSACGGTHRLMGYSFAIKQRVLQGQPLQGQYLRAAKFINEFIEYTWQLQNPDGSFSTNWFEGRGNEPNVERKVQTTGHMLEWLLFTVSDQDVRSKRVEKAIDFLMSNIYDNRQLKWPIGPRGHATRALSLYEKRLSEILSEPQEQSEAQQGSNIAGSSAGSSNNSELASPGPLVGLPQGAVTQGTPQRTSQVPGKTSSPARVGTAQRVVRPARPRR
jgi:hypothetical protein